MPSKSQSVRGGCATSGLALLSGSGGPSCTGPGSQWHGTPRDEVGLGYPLPTDGADEHWMKHCGISRTPLAKNGLSSHSLQCRHAEISLQYRRINPVRKERARCLVSRPRLVERNIRMNSQGERLVLALKSVVIAPIST